MSVRNQPKLYEANRRPKGRHSLFCFISFIGIYYPLTDIVIVDIVLQSLRPFLRSFMIAPTAHFITLGANATTCLRQAIYILISIRPYLRLFIVGAAEGGERRQTNTPQAYLFKTW